MLKTSSGEFFLSHYQPAKRVLIRGNIRAPQRFFSSIPCSQYHLHSGAVPLQGDLPTGAMHTTLLTSVQEHRYMFQYLLYNGCYFFLVWTEFAYPPKISLFPPTLDCFPPINHSYLDSHWIFPFLITISKLFAHLHNIYTSSLNFCIISIIFLTKDRLFWEHVNP